MPSLSYGTERSPEIASQKEDKIETVRSNVVYFVKSTGSDSNLCMTEANPCLKYFFFIFFYFIFFLFFFYFFINF
jgi:hypothetical protein